MQLTINSGYLVEDPADANRYMLIAYNAEHDAVFVFRRAECQSIGDIAEDLEAAEAAGGDC